MMEDLRPNLVGVGNLLGSKFKPRLGTQFFFEKWVPKWGVK